MPSRTVDAAEADAGEEEVGEEEVEGDDEMAFKPTFVRIDAILADECVSSSLTFVLSSIVLLVLLLFCFHLCPFL